MRLSFNIYNIKYKSVMRIEIIDELSFILFHQHVQTQDSILTIAPARKFWVPFVQEEELHYLRSQCGFSQKTELPAEVLS
jgi:hypothetical protein